MSWWLMMLVNLLLIPPVVAGLTAAYYHFLGGPFTHHRLYSIKHHHQHQHDEHQQHATQQKSNTILSSPPSPFTSHTHANSSSSGRVSSVRTARTILRLLHQCRLMVFGSDESSLPLRLFRSYQHVSWHMYKSLLRRLDGRGELERLMVESDVVMVPHGSCLDERVGFHPHLITVAVRMSAYMRQSKQLREVLRMEEKQQEEERREATMQSQSHLTPSSHHLDPSMGDSEDESLISAPFLNRRPSRQHIHSQPSSSPSAPASPTSTLDSSFMLLSSASSPLSTTSRMSSMEESDRRANSMLQLLVACKGINRTSGASYSSIIRPILYRSLLLRNQLDEFINYQLRPMTTIKYDKNNVQHEAWLEELWQRSEPLIRPFISTSTSSFPFSSAPATTDSPSSSTVNRDWELIGFQSSSNPRTDFRGMGLLCLHSLLSFVHSTPIYAASILKHGLDSDRGALRHFSFAITGMTLTKDLVDLTMDHRLDAYYYTYGANWKTFNALYATIFVKFDEFWCECNPSSVMEFQFIHGRFLKLLQSQAQAFPFTLALLSRDEFDVRTMVTPVTPRPSFSTRHTSTPGSHDQPPYAHVEARIRTQRQQVRSQSEPGSRRGSDRGKQPKITPNGEDDEDGDEDEDDDDIGECSPLSLSRRTSKDDGWPGASLAAPAASISRSVSPAPFSQSRSVYDEGVEGTSPAAANLSPPLSPLSRAVSSSHDDDISSDIGHDVIPLGNLLDPICHPSAFIPYQMQSASQPSSSPM